MKIRNLVLLPLVALPLLTACNKNNSSNTELANLNSINKLLSDNKDNINTCYDAIYNTSGVVSKLTKDKLTGSHEFVYDSKAKQFVIMDGDTVVMKSNGYTAPNSTLDYFKFVDVYNPNSKYSQYLKKDASGTEQLLITTGFDAGTHKDIRNIAYTNLSDRSDEVIIRTYCDYLSLYAPKNTVNHYNVATNVIVTDIGRLNTYGTSAYMKAYKGTIDFDNSVGETDMFEVTKGNEEYVYIYSSADENKSNVYGLVNVEKGTDEKHHKFADRASTKVLKTVEIRSQPEFETYVTSGEKNFLRLESDIPIDYENNRSGYVVSHALCIDLNGFKLSFSNAKPYTAAVNEALRIQSSNEAGSAADKSVYIVDSTGVLDEHAGIYLNDCSIVVSGPSTQGSNSSNLVLNSGKITQTISNASDTVGAAVFLVGNTSETHINPKEAAFSMYGGKISCTNNSIKTDSFGCIGAVGDGSKINVVYGVLSSDDFCIYGSTMSGYDLSNAEVNIAGGVLSSGSETNSKNTAIYFPLKSTINIESTTITGASCVNVNSGSLTIKDSTLTSYGTAATVSEKNYDGSVIYIPKKKLDSADLTVSVDNSSLTSKFKYIACVTGPELSEKTTSLSFESGTYNYYLGDGVDISSAQHAQILNKNGTWTKRAS